MVLAIGLIRAIRRVFQHIGFSGGKIMDSKSKIVFGALFGVVLISAFAYALPSSGRQNAFSWMMGGASQNNGFGMMGNRSFGAGNAGFGMMGNWNGNGFNSSSMLSMHNLMHGTNLTSEEFANLHKGFQGF